MTIGRYAHRRDEPFFWWGSPRAPSPIVELAELITSDAIGRETAALALLLLRRGLPLLVISEASGAGKSTLLHALLESARLDRQRIYLRGSYESFEFQGGCDPAECILLVNEISPHLPAYLWGRPVRQLFEAATAGFQIAGTAHATSPADFLHSMTSPPLEVPAELVMRPMAFLVLPGALLSGLRPGERPASVLIEALDESVGLDARLHAASQLLAAATLSSTELRTEYENLLTTL